MKLSQVRMLVDDFPECFRFYRDALGLEPTFGGENDGYASFGNIALFERTEQTTVVEIRPTGDGALVCLAAADLDAAIEKASANGGAFLGPPVARPDWGLRVTYLRDPAGHLVELHEDIPMEEG